MPRTMKELPSVTMKAGTLSLAMMAPLMKPTRPAPASAARSPTTSEGKSGSPALNTALIASAASTEARLMTQPTERSMPAPMMTKVWPSPRRRTGVIATRMFCEFRVVRKLTEPLLASGTTTTKKTTIRPRKAHAHTRLRNRTSWRVRPLTPDAGPISSAILDPVSATSPSLSNRQIRHPGESRNPSSVRTDPSPQSHHVDG